MKRILFVVGCAFSLMSCVANDDQRPRGEGPAPTTFGPDNEEEQCPLLEPGACRADASCRQQGQCLGIACQQIEVTGCLPLDVSAPRDNDGHCETLNTSACGTRADCLSATSLEGGHLCLPEDRTQDTHLEGDNRRVLNVISPQAMR